jgi:superkiller protein 3
VEEAVHQYETALRLNPDNNPEAHYNLALALARQGKRQEAINHLTEALRARPDYPDARRELGLLSAPSQR